MEKIVIAGDFVPSDRVLKLIKQNKYKNILGDIGPLIAESDYSIVNLESPLIYGELTPIVKNGPNLDAPIETLDVIKEFGFKCVTLANNHFYDQGIKGAITTIEECEKHKIDYVGAGSNLYEASKTLYREINGIKYAFINCCEHEYSIATENLAGSNPINPIQQYYEIVEAKKRAKYVVIICHGGIEHFNYPTTRMVQWYRFFIDAGVDAVVNHHQHCPCGYEIYKGKPICYGLGNFCFDSPNKRKMKWNKGYLAELVFTDGNVKLNIIPYDQCSNDPSVFLLKNDERNFFLREIAEISNVISNTDSLNMVIDTFMGQNERTYDSLFVPYNNKFLLSLYKMGFLPNFYDRYKWSRLRDLITCESHNERFCHFIMSTYKKVCNK